MYLSKKKTNNQTKTNVYQRNTYFFAGGFNNQSDNIIR